MNIDNDPKMKAIGFHLEEIKKLLPQLEDPIFGCNGIFTSDNVLYEMRFSCTKFDPDNRDASGFKIDPEKD